MTLLFIIDSDPQGSHKPAEAVRIAAGIGTWERLTLRLFLKNSAAKILNETAVDLVDQEHFGQYLPLLEESGHTIYVDRAGTEWIDSPRTLASFNEAGDGDLVKLSSEATYLLHF